MLIPLLLTALNTQATADDLRDPRQFFFIQSFGDLPEEMQIAGDQGKKGMLLFFETEGCPYCAAMLKGVLSRKQVQDWYGERFVNIAIDIRGDVEIRDFDGITLPAKVFAEHRRVTITPTLSFIDFDGTEVYRHTGVVKTPEEFLVLGEFIAGKHYYNMGFKDFAKQHGLQNTVSGAGQ